MHFNFRSRSVNPWLCCGSRDSGVTGSSTDSAPSPISLTQVPRLLRVSGHKVAAASLPILTADRKVTGQTADAAWLQHSYVATSHMKYDPEYSRAIISSLAYSWTVK